MSCVAPAIVLPGEIAPAHRHVASALRFVIEGANAYTAVDGERTTMAPGDFVITPSWTWHDHGNESDGPMVWLDGLDMHVVNLLDAGFREAYPEPVHPITRPEGAALAEAGMISQVQWDGPAFNQGMFVGATIVAVNGDAYSADGLRRAITAAKTSRDPIQLLAKNGDQYQIYAIDYHSGLRYPHLERVRGAPDRIGAIFAARSH